MIFFQKKWILIHSCLQCYWWYLDISFITQFWIEYRTWKSRHKIEFDTLVSFVCLGCNRDNCSLWHELKVLLSKVFPFQTAAAFVVLLFLIASFALFRPVVDMGKCFLRYPYQKMITLVNPSPIPARYEMVPQERTSRLPVLYDSPQSWVSTHCFVVFVCYWI